LELQYIAYYCQAIGIYCTLKHYIFIQDNTAFIECPALKVYGIEFAVFAISVYIQHQASISSFVIGRY